MSSSLTIRPERSFPSGQIALLEFLGLCLPGGLLVFSLLAHEWWTSAFAFLILAGLVARFRLDWGRTAITVQSGQIQVSSPYGFRREIPAAEVDQILRAGSNLYFVSGTGERLGAFPAGILTSAQLQRLATHLGVEVA